VKQDWAGAMPFVPECGDKVEEALVQEQARQAPSVAQGSVSRTPVALKNLELSKPWLEARRSEAK